MTERRSKAECEWSRPASRA